MHLLKLFFIGLLLLICGPPCWAAEDSLQYKLEHYTNENGLPQNSIKAIATDEYGFVWLATEAGLVRFDGQKFKLFNKRNTGIQTSRIVTIEKEHFK